MPVAGEADSSGQTLVESAAAHQAKQTKPELTSKVDVKTGEENESNVFQVRYYIAIHDLHNSQDTRYKNFIHNPMRGKGKRSGVADRSVASPTYNTNIVYG